MIAKTRKNISMALVVWLCLWGTGFGLMAGAQSQGSVGSDGLRLPVAVEIALRGNPLVRASASGREMADAQLSEERSARLPVLQFSENFIRSNNPVFVFGSLLEQARFGASNFALPGLNNPDSLSNYRTALTLKMPVFDQWRSSTRINQAKFLQRQAEAQTDQVHQQLRYEVLKSFYGVLLAEAGKEVADEAVKLAQADIKRSRDRMDAGVAVASDLLAAEVQLAEFRQQQIQAEGEIVTARAALNTVLGLPIETPQKIAGELAEKTFSVSVQDELMEEALRHRPDYSRAGLALSSSREGVRAARGENLPRFDVYTSFGTSGRNLWSGSGDYLVGASLSFNLLDFGRSARINRARAAETMAMSEQQHLANQIRLEVVRANQQYLTARERLVVAGRVINHATEALRIVQDRYNEGLTTITEVLRAETALVRARLNLLTARYDHYLGYAGVLLVTGRLTDVQPFVS